LPLGASGRGFGGQVLGLRGAIGDKYRKILRVCQGGVKKIKLLATQGIR